MNKPLVTQHQVSPRLAKLANIAPPKKPAIPSRVPNRPVAPPSRVAAAPKPRTEISRNVRPIDSARADSTIASMNRRAAQLASGDTELGFDDNESNLKHEIIDISKIDPGPSREDVPCGYNCGSCRKFLALNDPRRDDPEFMENYLGSNDHCPIALPELAKVKGKTIDEIVSRANDTACPKFKLDTRRISEEFGSLLGKIRLLTKGEFDILAASLDTIGREKALEEKYGYRLNERVKTSVQGYDGVHSGIVVGFKGKNVLIKVVVGRKELVVRRQIIDAKPIED